MQTQHYLYLTRAGYFALLALIPAWHLWLSPPALEISPWLITTIWLVPLLFPLRGILKADPYTFAWSAFIALLYVMHAIVIFMSDSSEQLLAVVELLCSLCFLIGTIYFAKYRGRELGLSIRKPKKKK